MTGTIPGAGDTAVTKPSASSAQVYILVGKRDIRKFTNPHRRSFQITMHGEKKLSQDTERKLL